MKMHLSMPLLAVYGLILSLFVTDTLQQARKCDIVFLIDGSPGMGRSFALVREFLKKVIPELDIGPDKDQVAVVQYSFNPRLEFGLNTYSTKDEVLDAIKLLKFKTGKPLNTGAALDYVTNNVFSPSAGSRRDAGASQILVLITAGKSRDDVGQAAEAVKQAGIVSIAIGAKGADTSELQQIVSNPDSILKLRDFRELQTIQQELLSKIRPVFVVEEPILPTEALRSSEPIVQTMEGPTVIIGVTSEIENRRDIVFLIDESDYIGNSNLPYVLDFITRIIENLNIGSDRVRVGLVLYSNTAETEFYLNTYSRKDEVLSLLRALRFKGGMTLNTGKALDFVLRYHFTRSAGSRREEGVPQFLVLITGGRSGDDIKPSADALKRAAIITLTVGARNTDPAQLKEVAFEPSLAFNVRDFNFLSDMQEKVMTSLQRLHVQSVPIEEATILIQGPLVTSTKVSSARKSDIVFLIDGSAVMGRSFPLVREFLKKVILELEIGPDKDQVAVVQYSFNPRLEFGLNTYSTKDEVLDAIKKLKFKTGKPLNTGAALDYVTNNVFSPSAGSRRDAGASQILVLITAGKSRDDVGQAADAVKQAGIVSIAIGAKSADTSELQQIVSNADSVLKLRDFRELQTIQQELRSKIRPVFVIEEPIVVTQVLPMEMNKRDIVFLIDGSDNVGNRNLPFVRDFITRIIQNLAIGSDKVQVGLAQYSDDTEAEFYLNTYSSENELLSHIRSLSLRGGTTVNTGSALDFAIKYYFTSSTGSRIKENVPQFLVLVTGGRSSDDVEAPADALKRAAVMTFAVGVKHSDPAQLEEIAIDPSLIFNVKEFHSLSDIENQMLVPLTTLTVPTVIIEEPTIKTEEEPVPTAEAKKRDIVFLFEGSTAMGRSFPLVREFLKKVIPELDIGPDKDQVAVVQYSSNPRLEFGLNTYSTKDDVLDAIKKLKFKTGRSLNTGAALDYVTNNVFNPTAGSRRDAGASQILVLITAGKSRDDVGQAADAVKQAGIVSIAIGAKGADTSELQKIVSNPDSVLKLRDFQELQTIQQELLAKIRPVFVVEEPIPPTEVVPMEMSERDIVFLIDGSDNVGNRNLPFVRDFITRIIQNLAIGSDKVRVGLAQYSDDTEAEFYLNTYSSENELLSHIRSLSLRGGTTVNTGSALDFAIKYYFTSSAGSRIKENVPQFLVLVTGGRSSDDVEAPADALKRAAVMTFAVGVKHSDPAQLEEIAIDPSLIFNVKEFHSLSDIENQMIVPLTTLTVPTVTIVESTIRIEEEPVPTTEARERDIVFLLDGSAAMGRSFLLVRKFLKKVILELDIGPDKDQVAVVQYSSNPRLEFGLNTYSTKDDVLDAIKLLKFKTGRSLNTGAALDYVTKNVFSPSTGSRRDAGASQILVLITAGKSTDEVGQAADAVNQAGIVPIAIGAKGADTSELQQIVSNPDSVLKLRDFRELQNIQQELLSKVRPVFVVEEPIPPTEVVPMEMSERDIVFLIDGSDNVGNRNLPFVRDFITRIIQNVAIGSDKVRVGLAQYSDDTEAEFYLNTYSSENELLSHIRSLSLRGGTTVNTGSALDFAIKYYFTSSAGSRIKENVPQFLVLVTGGRSSDDVEAPADALKRAAVMTFAVGVKHSDPAQLEEIAIDPSLIFNVKEFHSLSDIENQMIVPLTTLTVPSVTIVEPTIRIEEEPVPTTEARKSDIVFLIDGSPGMGRSFSLVREFLYEVIQELDIGSDKDQVAVVQYSFNPRLEFGLNTYSTKDEILDAIKKLKFKTGKPLNTGAALGYVTNNVFSSSAGSRRDAGTSQILVLITAGKSRDDVRQAAYAVKQAGIVSIAIGAKGADTSELQEIVSNPDSVLKLRDFQELQTIQQELLSKIRPVFVVEEPIPPTEVLPMEMSERDIVFLIDGSDNVGNRNLPFVRDFITRIIQNVAIGSDKVRVGLAQYSDDTEAEFYLNTYSSENELLSHIRSLSLRGGTTVNTGSALDFAIKYYFTSSAGSRIKENVPQFLVLVTGGRSSDDVEAPADALKRAAVMTFAVGVKHSDPAQLEEIAIDPSLIFNVKEFHSLSDIENQMIVPLTTLTVPSVTIVEPTIRIEEEPVPTTEVAPQERDRRDVVFLIDGSVGNVNFIHIRDFITKLIENLDVGSDGVQVAVAQYSNDVKTECYLNSYPTKADLVSRVKGLKVKGGRTVNTGAALDYVLRNHFTQSAGSRKEEGVPQILMLFTGGRSRDEIKSSADALKRAAVMTFSVGARKADPAQLKEISSDPSLVFSVKEFRSLRDIQDQVMRPLSTPVMTPLSTMIVPTVTTTEAAPQERKRRDVVFLIDGSVGNVNFIHIRDFITKLIENLDVGSDGVQVAVAQYSNDVKTECYLNSYPTKADLVSRVKGLKVKGGRTVNTGAALDYVLRNHFTQSAGSRKEEGVPQILMLFTGGRSRDEIKSSADALKRAAVMTFSVGARKADPAQLKEISSDPSLVFSVKEFRSLRDIQDQVMTPLSVLPALQQTTEEPTVAMKQVLLKAVSKRDIVFLIDGSDNVGDTDFPFVHDFLTSIIENLDIGSDRVQIGLVQYSNYAETEFYLNTYSSEDEILSHVEGLRLRGGMPLNTGAALDYVLKNHFTRSSGSRKEEGVPQILVLITAGRSRDYIKPSADALKQAAVTIFAVGARNADAAQVTEIASDRSLSLSVQEFRALPHVQEQVMMSMSTLPPSHKPTDRPTVPINPEKTSKRDIVFLIDGSDNVGHTDFSFVHDFLTSIIENLDIGSDRVQIGLVQYSNYAETEFYLNTYSSEDEILSHVEGLRLRGGMPLNTGAALDYILRSHFTRSSGSRKEEGVPQILVLITAGRSRDYTKPSADALKQAAVTIFAVGARNADAAQVTEIASDPSLSLSVQEFRALPHVQEQVMILMSTLPPSREPTDRSTVPINPVVADGTNKRDIVFLIDGSDNVGNADLPFIRDFITSIIENLDIGSDRVKIGLVQYSNYAETEFYLNTYSSEDEVLSHVEGLRLRGGMPLNTGAALDYVLRSHFTRSSGSRKEEGVPQILVLITAGRSSNDVKPSADALKHDAVITFAVGARNADPAQLKEIAVDPTLVFSVQEFRSLPQVQEQLMTPLTTLAASRVPIERPPVTEQVVPEEGNKRDIVFLIDGSDNIGNTNFAHVRDFLTSIIQNLDIGNDRIQVGLVQYSTYAETEFYLNTYLSKAEILFHIKGLRLKGGTRLNTGAALDYVYKYHFIGSAGSRRREGIPQFLVLLTGGRSSDDAKLAAGALKQAAIMNFAVGVKNADSAQLKEIAIDPSLVFSTNEFYSLPNIQEEVTTLLSTLPAPRTIPEEPTAVTKRVIPDGASKRDIVFLIDGSDYVGNTNFPFVRDFLTNIIENLNIGSDKIQIGLVQYSNYAETEFYLNTYSSEDEILSHVKGLRLRGGTTLNTGVALDSVLRYHFTRSAGSRKEEGVPQVLVLITSGRSRDDVKLPADTLKRAAVKIIAIGAENANPIQIKEIADDTSLVFSVEEFRSMPDILEQVMISLLTLAAPAVTHNKPTVITERPTDTVIEVTSEIENRRDIVFLIDESDYIGNSNLPYVRDFITRIIENLDIGSDRVRVGLVLYSNNAETEFYLNTYSRKDEVLSLLRPLRFKGGMTLNTGKALDFVLRYHFTRSAGSRREEGVPQFLVLITGGRSGDDIKPSADALKRAAIITLTVGARSADPAQLKEMAFEPSLAFNARDLYSLSEIQEKVMTPLQKLRDPKLIIDEPTVHIGDPMVTSTKARKSDIVFLIDGSPGMGRSFALVREFLKKVIQELDIGPDKDQVAVVQYSFNPRLEFGLNTYSTKDEVLDAIKKLKFKTGKPLNTGAALDYVTNNVFSPSAGSRRDAGASQILVLITAGKSRDDVGQAAEAVKQAGIVSIAIGAKGADTSELQQIVSNPDSVLKLRDFQELQTIQQELLSKIRPVFIMEKSTVTTEVLPKEMSERDIVFLIDGSDNVGNTNLPFVRDFMTRIIQNLAIGSDKVRVGLAQYSDDTEAEFYLNTYSSENELLSHIRSLSLRGGTTVNTGSALDFAIKYYFTSFAGSRIKENVPQFLVLVTGGRSSDDVEAPADALKRAAVMTFAVGVKHSDPAQLEEIAIDPSLIFNVKEFHSLSDIENQMIIPLTTLTVPTVIEEPIISIEEEVVTTTEARRRDIVFLIDGSPGMGRSFPLVRKFLMEVIQELDIGPDKDQVSVVQYSLDSRVEFGLGSHSTKDEVLNALQKLRLKTGRLLNTGAALDYVTKNVFSPSAGSRRDAGASQILVLITAGKSRDDVGQAADAVKQAGIVPIAIGAKGADTSELQQIVYEPNFVLKLRDFRELQTIQKELISKVKTVFIIEEMTTVNTEVSPEEVNKRDIVFLIDGSDNVGNTNLLIVHDFIKNIIENLNIGSDRVRIGLAQFSHDSQTEFYLNTYSKKAEILSHVKGLKLKGGTMLNTGAALDFVFRNHFTSHAGSRKEHGVPQFLVVFTGGRSVDAVKPYADALKRAAIATFAVGVRNADPAQLQEIATDPTLVFSVKEFHNLPHVQERVMTPLSTLSAPTVTIGESTVIAGEPLITNEEASAVRQRDIVFLIDGTLGMGKAFPLVRAFLMKVIQELDIAPDKDQVAVVQYSHNPKTEFGLNTYASKDDVLVATTQLRRKTGRALNTGAALNYVIRNVFITSAGSRQDTGATQILVLITAGKSRDDVGLAANAVKQAGIVSIAIGAKNAHSAELRQIVYSPDFMFVLKTFQTVPTIQQQLLSILKLVSGESLEDQPHRIT